MYIRISPRMNTKILTFWFVFVFSFEFPLLSAGSLTSLDKIQTKEIKVLYPSLEVVGIILSEKPTASIAVLRGGTAKRLMIVKIGDEIFDMKLTNIFKNRIVLKKGEIPFQVYLGNNKLKRISGKKEKRSGEMIISRERNITSNSNKNNFIKRIELERQIVERKIKTAIPRLINKVKINQNLVNGEMKGIKIAELPKDDFISQLEIYRNDIIKEINGIQINDFRTLFSIYDKLRNQSQFEVILERNGTPIRILYILK